MGLLEGSPAALLTFMSAVVSKTAQETGGAARKEAGGLCLLPSHLHSLSESRSVGQFTGW